VVLLQTPGSIGTLPPPVRHHDRRAAELAIAHGALASIPKWGLLS
jgi:hypothetical protein